MFLFPCTFYVRTMPLGDFPNFEPTREKSESSQHRYVLVKLIFVRDLQMVSRVVPKLHLLKLDNFYTLSPYLSGGVTNCSDCLYHVTCNKKTAGLRYDQASELIAKKINGFQPIFAKISTVDS